MMPVAIIVFYSTICLVSGFRWFLETKGLYLTCARV